MAWRNRGRGGGRGGRGGGGRGGGPVSAGKGNQEDQSMRWLAQSITCHAWNHDRTRVALCPNSNIVEIYSYENKIWKKEHTLANHDQIIMGIDWGHKLNRIVTCGQDRNAYVWKYEDGEWKPTLVILRLNRACTDVQWSPNEDKFAVASGAKSISVCYFEEDNDWWVSKHIKKNIKSTVLSIDWHPNNILIASASSDFKCHVHSGFVKGVDQKPDSTPFGMKLRFGESLGEYPSSGWVHCARWSPSGNQICITSHDSTVAFIDVTEGAPGEYQIVKVKGLPFVNVFWLNENNVVAAGHSMYPQTYVKTEEGWVTDRNLDEKKVVVKKEKSSVSKAFEMWGNKVDKGQTSNQTKLKTRQLKVFLLSTYFGLMKIMSSLLDTVCTLKPM
eukprot:TRINITY_DN228_c1_g4_i1.p1 TRINITY_DN228_c1_g4~~TRINITY_DN228_c1_g4_i1.p1  ORF type:complete len:387 (-),score=90.66 TRINITY_DN228_c1_g4_i1:48-1208(-)